MFNLSRILIRLSPLLQAGRFFFAVLFLHVIGPIPPGYIKNLLYIGNAGLAEVSIGDLSCGLLFTLFRSYIRGLHHPDPIRITLRRVRAVFRQDEESSIVKTEASSGSEGPEERGKCLDWIKAKLHPTCWILRHLLGWLAEGVNSARITSTVSSAIRRSLIDLIEKSSIILIFEDFEVICLDTHHKSQIYSPKLFVDASRSLCHGEGLFKRFNYNLDADHLSLKMELNDSGDRLNSSFDTVNMKINHSSSGARKMDFSITSLSVADPESWTGSNTILECPTTNRLLLSYEVGLEGVNTNLQFNSMYLSLTPKSVSVLNRFAAAFSLVGTPKPTEIRQVLHPGCREESELNINHDNENCSFLSIASVSELVLNISRSPSEGEELAEKVSYHLDLGRLSSDVTLGDSVAKLSGACGAVKVQLDKPSSVESRMDLSVGSISLEATGKKTAPRIIVKCQAENVVQLSYAVGPNVNNGNLQVDGLCFYISPQSVAVLHRFATAIPLIVASNAPVMEEPDSESRVEVVHQEQQVAEVFNMLVRRFQLEFGCGREILPRPLFTTEIDLKAELKRHRTSSYVIQSEVMLGCSYYNSNRAVHQPLIERWDVTDTRKAAISVNYNKPNITVKLAEEVDVLLTPRLIEVALTLANAFQTAVEEPDLIETKRLHPSFFSFTNHLPVVATLVLGDFRLVDGEHSTGIASQETVYLALVDEAAEQGELGFVIDESSVNYVTVDRPRKHNIKIKNKYNRTQRVVVEVANDFGYRSITLRCKLEVVNHLHVPIDVYYDKNLIGSVEARETFHVPLMEPAEISKNHILEPEICRNLETLLRFSKHKSGFEASCDLLNDRCIKQSVKKKNVPNYDLYGVTEYTDSNEEEVITEPIHPLFSVDNDSSSTTVHVRPSLVVQNALPYEIEVTVLLGNFKEKSERKSAVLVEHPKEAMTIPPGGQACFLYFVPLSSELLAEMKDYFSDSWICKVTRQDGYNEGFTKCTFQAKRSQGELQLGLHKCRKDGNLYITFFSPCWVINNTKLDLTYRQNNYVETDHLAVDEFRPLLLDFLDTVDLHVRVKTTEEYAEDWEEVSLLTAGHVTCCNEEGQQFPIGSYVYFNHEGLTKQLILTPFFMLANTTLGMTVHYREAVDGQDWNPLAPGEKRPFWPLMQENRSVIFRNLEQDDVTTPIMYDDGTDNSPLVVLPFGNRNTATAGLVVDVCHSPSAVFISCGQIEPEHVLVLCNNCSQEIEFYESNVPKLVVKAGECVDFIPSDPAKRKLMMCYREKIVTSDVFGTPDGSYRLPNTDSAEESILSWITVTNGRRTELRVAEYDQELASSNIQPADIQITFDAKRLGFNLVSDELGDVFYAKLSEFSLSCTKGQDYSEVHCQVESLQVDNMLTDCIYSTIFARLPDQQQQTESHVLFDIKLKGRNRISELKLAISESILNVELQSLIDLFSIINPRIELNQHLRREGMTANDIAECFQGLDVRSSVLLTNATRYDWEKVDIHVLGLVASFSTAWTKKDSTVIETIPWINVIRMVHGFNGVSIRIPELTLRDEHLSMDQLQKRALKQILRDMSAMSVQAVGDNAVKLITRTTDGIQRFFLEPLHGKVRNEISANWRTFFSKVVGHSAGFAAELMDAMGQTVDSVTGDFESQRRKNNLGRPGTKSTDKFVRSANHLLNGFTRALGGVVTKPIEGAKKSGLTGFFQGTLNAVVGLFTKPTSAFMSCSSVMCRTLEYELEEQKLVARMRLPRFLEPDRVIPLYDRHKAEGFQLMRDIGGGNFAQKDLYIDHADVVWRNGETNTLFLTDRGAVVATKKGKVVWNRSWDELRPNQPEIGGGGEQLFFRYKSGQTSIRDHLVPTKRRKQGKLMHTLTTEDAKRIKNSRRSSIYIPLHC